MKKSWKSFMTVTAAAAAMTAAMAFSVEAAVAKVDDDLPENRHIVSVASGGYETGFQIKAAHGADIYETTSYPIDKKADGEDEIGTVSQGKKIRFTLNSSLPKLLARYVVTASNAVIENRAQSGAVQVVAVDVQPGAFAIGDFENFGSEAGKIAFSINGCKTVKEGKLTLADGAFPVIDAGKNLRIAYTAKVTATEKVEKVNAATLIFTIAPATGNS